MTSCRLPDILLLALRCPGYFTWIASLRDFVDLPYQTCMYAIIQLVDACMLLHNLLMRVYCCTVKLPKRAAHVQRPAM